MNKFKVKIVSCKVSSYWYSDMIGQVVEVVDCQDEVLNTYKTSYKLAGDRRNYFSIDDCIKLDEYRDKCIESLLNI